MTTYVHIINTGPNSISVENAPVNEDGALGQSYLGKTLPPGQHAGHTYVHTGQALVIRELKDPK